MKYNSKYDRYVDDDLVIYRYDKNKDKLVQCHIGSNGKYKTISTSKGKIYLHRFVYETFVGEIPDCMEVDHIDTDKNNNYPTNLRVCSRKENCNNPLTLKHRREFMKGKLKGRVSKIKGQVFSDFGKKFKEHFGITNDDSPDLYSKEHLWYYRHNKTCSWEK